MRFDCNDIGDVMSEVDAYGTAVTVEPLEPTATAAAPLGRHVGYEPAAPRFTGPPSVKARARTAGDEHVHRPSGR
jgi:hypothetical protein